ncbi:MAG: CDP-glucose 4,6-dehydratase [Methylacidiphilales bacterium]|nr:CDP-glucose 4,6-dehydratase [Candidatus Methylacidiphilales bacterium]
MTATFWRGRRVFLTGHTGFKGSWLTLLLAKMGANVSGFALAPSTEPNLYGLAGVEAALAASTISDLRDRDALARAMAAADPEVIFHLAAQPLVRESYADPVGTYATNVLGTAHLLDAARHQPNLQAVVIVTTDKCYENSEWIWGYRENDRLGGHDPYSNSKACAELVTDSFRRSFFKVTPGAARIATVRAGNVVGGGDWSKDRLVPDILRGCFSPSGEVIIRNPAAVRPWQHVLDPLWGYILLAEILAGGIAGFDEGWNFGPPAEDVRPVIEVAEAMVAAVGTGKLVINQDPRAPHEANLLQLDSTKARTRLTWRPKLGFSGTIAMTADWYRAWACGEDMAAFTLAQISQYEAIT